MSNLVDDNNGSEEVVEVKPTAGVGVWSESIESYLITLIEDEVKKGNRPTTTLTKSAWKFIKNKLKEKTGKDYSFEQLRNKYNQLRQRWKDFGKLLEETGIGYNAMTFEVSAEEEVWKKLYEKHKCAKVFKKKGCKNYDKLCTIFGDTTATGANSHPSTKSPSDIEDEEEKDDDDNEEEPKAKKAKSASKSKNLRERVNTAMADALVAISENSKKKLELLEKRMSVTTSTASIYVNDVGRNESTEDHDTLMKSIDALTTLEEIDGSSFAKAIKLIHDDPLWRKIFLRLPDDRKRDFVLNI